MTEKSIECKLTSFFSIITEDCNNKCLHCYNHYDTRKCEYMTKETFDISLKKFIDAGAGRIAVSGGEALIHPDFEYFLDEIKNSGLKLRLYSNAQNINKNIAKKLSAMNISPCSLTLYSIKPEIHDKITQNKGSCEKTKAAMKLLKEYDVPFLVSVPLTKLNIADFEKTFDWCQSVGAVSVGPNPFISYTVDHAKNNKNICPDEGEIKKFAIEYLAYQKNRKEPIFPKKIEKTGQTKIFHTGKEGNLTILPNGDLVAGTLLADLVLGNVNTDSVIDIWNNSEKLNEWRKYMISDLDGCIDCPILSYCRLNIGDNWVANHNLLEADKHLCELYKIYYETLFSLSF